MNLTKSEHSDSMVLGSTRIEVSTVDVAIDTEKKTWELVDLFDLGLARGVKLGFQSSKIDIKADNGDVPLKGITDNKATVEFAVLERHLPTLGKVMGGLVHTKIIGGEPKSENDTLKANTVTTDKVLGLVKQNFDLSEPKNVVIKQGSKTLSKGVDYELQQLPSLMWGVLFKSTGAFDVSKATSIAYEVAPIKSYRLSKGSGGLATPISMRLTAMRQGKNGKRIERIYEFPFGFYNAEDSIAFKSKNDTDNVAEVPMKFEFTPHPDMLLDEELEAMSLYREDDKRN